MPRVETVRAVVRPGCTYGSRSEQKKAGEIIDVEPEEMFIAKETLMPLAEWKKLVAEAELAAAPKQDKQFEALRASSRQMWQDKQDAQLIHAKRIAEAATAAANALEAKHKALAEREDAVPKSKKE